MAKREREWLDGWGLYHNTLHCIVTSRGRLQIFCIAIHILYCDIEEPGS